MNKRHRITSLSLAGVLLLSITACSDSATDNSVLKSNSGILKYVPFDTPYVFAAAKPFPDGVREKLAPHTEALIGSYRSLLKATVRQSEADKAGNSEGSDRKFIALIDALADMVTPEGIPEAGIDRSSTGAIYGVGLLPVMRIALTDGALFESALSRFEEKAGASMSTASIDGHRYRFAGQVGGNGRFVVAVLGNQLVMSLVPGDVSEQHLAAVLGIELPHTNIAESGRLAALAEKYSFTPYGLGVMDFEQLAAVFLSDADGLEGDLLTLMGYETSGLSAVCQAEMLSLATVAPRLVSGYTTMSEEQMRMNTVIELRDDLAAGLKALASPVPGLGAEQDGIFSFGMGFNLQAARDFYSTRLDVLEADPYQCELLQGLQMTARTGRAALTQPVPPIVYGFRGFLAVIDDITGLDLKTRQPPTNIDMRLLLATDNAQALLAIGRMFSPEIAALNLQPDSKPVKVDLPPVASEIDDAWLAMSENAIALAIGSASKLRLPAMLSTPAAESSPFLSLSMDAGRYYGFIGDAMERSDADAAPDGDIVKASRDVIRTLQQMFSRIAFEIRFTDHGVEMPSAVYLVE